MHKSKSTKLHINEDVAVAIVSDDEDPVILSIPGSTNICPVCGSDNCTCDMDDIDNLGNYIDDFEHGRFLTYDDISDFTDYDEDDILDDYVDFDDDFDDAPVIVMDDEDYSDYNERALGYADDIAD